MSNYQRAPTAGNQLRETNSQFAQIPQPMEWFAKGNTELRRGETAPAEKGKREKPFQTSSQHQQAGPSEKQSQFNMTTTGFPLSNTANMKEAIGKFKSSPYYSSVVNQQNQKKHQQLQQQHSWQSGGQSQATPSSNGIPGTLIPPDSSKGINKQQHIQQISRIYQQIPNPSNKQHGPSSAVQSTTTVTKKQLQQQQQQLVQQQQQSSQDPYNQQSTPSRYTYKLPQRPQTSGDHSSLQRRQSYQSQNGNGSGNPTQQMSATNTDGFVFKKPQTAVRQSGTASTTNRLLNTSGNFYSRPQTTNPMSMLQISSRNRSLGSGHQSNKNQRQNPVKEGSQYGTLDDSTYKRTSNNAVSYNSSSKSSQVAQKQNRVVRVPVKQQEQSTYKPLNRNAVVVDQDFSDNDTPRIIVTGNQEQISHKIEDVDNSFTRQRESDQCDDEERDENQYVLEGENQKNRRFVDQEEGDDEHDEEDEEQQEGDFENEGDHGNFKMEYKQYADPYDQDDGDDEEDEDEDDDDEEEEEEDEDQEDDDEEEEGQRYQVSDQGYDMQQQRGAGGGGRGYYPSNNSVKPATVCDYDEEDNNQLQAFIQNDDQNYQSQEDDFSETHLQKYMQEKMNKDKNSSKISSSAHRPMTTEGGRRMRAIETPSGSSQKNEDMNRFSINKSIQIENFEQSRKQSEKTSNTLTTATVESSQQFAGEKKKINLPEDVDDFFQNDQFAREFKIDFDTRAFERPPARGKQLNLDSRAPIKADHDIVSKEDGSTKEYAGKRPPSRHRLPNRATGLGIPTQDLQDIPIKNMYEKDDNQEFYPEANNCEFFENKKLKIEKIKQSQDGEDAFMNFDFNHFGENSNSCKNSSRQLVSNSKIYNERPQSGNLKSRGVNNKRDGLGESANKQFLPESTNLSNIQNLKLSNGPTPSRGSVRKSSGHQKENESTSLWDDFEEFGIEKSQPSKNIVRRLEGSDIIIKHNVSSSINHPKSVQNNSHTVKLPFETSLGQDFLSLFANHKN